MTNVHKGKPYPQDKCAYAEFRTATMSIYAMATPPLPLKNTGISPTDSSGLSSISQSLHDSILGLLINGKVSRIHTQTIAD